MQIAIGESFAIAFHTSGKAHPRTPLTSNVTLSHGPSIQPKAFAANLRQYFDAKKVLPYLAFKFIESLQRAHGATLTRYGNSSNSSTIQREKALSPIRTALY
jgi:hypothetical protein